MKKTFKRLGVAAVVSGGLLVGLLLLSAPRIQVAADGNMLKNAGFEDAQNGLPAGWNLEKKAADKGSATLVEQPRHGGQHALQLP